MKLGKASDNSKKIGLTFKRSKGQGMSEYLIIMGLIAVAGIAVIGFVASSVHTQLSGMATELSGGDATQNIQTAQQLASDAQTQAQEVRSLGNYGGQNQTLDQ